MRLWLGDWAIAFGPIVHVWSGEEAPGWARTSSIFHSIPVGEANAERFELINTADLVDQLEEPSVEPVWALEESAGNYAQ